MSAPTEATNVQPITVVYHQDPGHGWGEVSKALLKKLGIQNKITPFSYMRGQMAYLEEDTDLGLFMKAADEHGVKLRLIEKHVNVEHPIRTYMPYRYR